MIIKRLLFLGFSVEEDYFYRSISSDSLPQVAAYKYETRLISGLRLQGLEVICLATAAVSTYPKNKKIYFSPSKHSRDDTSKTMRMINLPALKMPSRFIGALFNLILRNGIDTATCVYSTHSPYLFAAFLNKIIFGVPFFVFVLDLPEYMNFQKKGRIFNALKKVDAKIIDFFILRANGLIVATKQMIEDFPNRRRKNYIVVEGIVDAQHCRQDISGEISSKKKNIIMYAGSVNEAHGIKVLVEGFLKSTCDAELWICGKGDLESYLTEISTEGRVRYFGYVSPDAVSKIQSQSKLQVLSRNPNEAYTRYSFPSKLLEYMSSGVPTLTTDLVGIPADLKPYLNFIKEYSVDGVCEAIESFFASPFEELSHLAMLGKRYVLENKSVNQQSKRIVEFMRSSV